MHSSVGGRTNNEDYCDYDHGTQNPVFALADGLGGYECGEIASEIAVRTAISQLKGNSRTDLYQVLAQANRDLLQCQASDPSLKKMRTTAVCARLVSDRLHYASIGDSRFYYFKAGKQYVRTKDHSVPQLASDAGQLDESEIRYSEDRNKLVKVLGDSEELVMPEPMLPVAVERGDAFLLCSDGFWENVFDLEMEIDLLKSVSAEEWAHRMLTRLLLRISGNHDNYSLICVKVF
ncbi:MAG: serine/threonine-protein phosphatase [Clostridia bacterium]|nr:serine/threonine-protein phosphatase [Clostridia bacterium]